MRRGEENREKERKRKGGGRKERKGGRKEGVRWREGDGDLPLSPSLCLFPSIPGRRVEEYRERKEGKKEKGRKERKKRKKRKAKKIRKKPSCNQSYLADFCAV